jgi:hypothetical protein
MSIRKTVAVLIVVALGTVWYQKVTIRNNDRLHQQLALSSHTFKDEPEQSDTSEPGFEFKGFSIMPLAVFRIRARVLSKASYSYDFQSELSPLDLALGWNRMADPSIYEPINISQGGRWYRYYWSNSPPIPLQEIIENSANMHMIPADQSVERVLEQAETGRYIKIYGFLVEATNSSGWKWRSSLSRSDSGMGSCEVIFVVAAEIE